MSIDLSSINLRFAKLKKLYRTGIIFGIIGIIAGIAAAVATITATTLEHFPKFIIFLAIYFICYIIMLIIQKKVDVEETKSRQDLAKIWAKLHLRG